MVKKSLKKDKQQDGILQKCTSTENITQNVLQKLKTDFQCFYKYELNIEGQWIWIV